MGHTPPDTSRPNAIVRSNIETIDNGETRRELAPTLQACAELQYAYAYFNEQLWDGTLPNCIITYIRKNNCLGHLAPDRFHSSNGAFAAELGLNPTYLAIRSDKDSLSTLVHEQAHVWRHYLGPLNRRGGRGANGYHDSVWSEEMQRIGLVPSDTGEPGGKMTGYQMTHYIEEGGLFDRACTELLDTGFKINWADRIVRSNSPDPDNGAAPPEAPTPKSDRIKFTCTECGLNAWAKPTAKLDCGNCRVSLRPADQV